MENDAIIVRIINEGSTTGNSRNSNMTYDKILKNAGIDKTATGGGARGSTNIDSMIKKLGIGGGGGIGETVKRTTGSMFAAVAKLNLMYNVVHEGVDILKNSINSLLNPIRSILTGIGKLLAQIFRPISDLIIVMLMPILTFLKPIIRAVMEIYKPFRKLMMEAMKSIGQAGPGGMAVGMTAVTGIAIAGAAAIIIKVLAEVFKFITVYIGSLIKNLLGPLLSILDYVFPGIAEGFNEKVDEGVLVVNAATDSMANGAIEGLLTSAKALKKSMDDNFKQMDLTTAASGAGTRMQSAIDAFWDNLNTKGGSYNNNFYKAIGTLAVGQSVSDPNNGGYVVGTASGNMCSNSPSIKTTTNISSTSTNNNNPFTAKPYSK